MQATKNKVVFTRCPQNIIDEFLNRVDSAYREADTVCVITDIRENEIHQRIIKLNEKLEFHWSFSSQD